ncbi:hypothetical protein [Actinopolymorpha pittospori]|uniref:Uncharacterized protein n=1 Tax=Actinopolymorpha pittospori TaxID=648752 RepID=A0A927MT86_9ACTN|nr:hypothetical protein [Actinopolymorpha pittospori]MBE1606219.1 hypothetical protein [Actinopolymorpha pittospori]
MARATKAHLIEVYAERGRAYGDLKRLSLVLREEGITERYGLRVNPFQGIFQLLLVDREPNGGCTDVQLRRVLLGATHFPAT